MHIGIHSIVVIVVIIVKAATIPATIAKVVIIVKAKVVIIVNAVTIPAIKIKVVVLVETNIVISEHGTWSSETKLDEPSIKQLLTEPVWLLDVVKNGFNQLVGQLKLSTNRSQFP